MPKNSPDLMTLFDLLDEQENGPKPCTHASRVSGWSLETDPESPYYLEWVDPDPRCRRSVKPGHYKQPPPTMGWSRRLQKDVHLAPF